MQKGQSKIYPVKVERTDSYSTSKGVAHDIYLEDNPLHFTGLFNWQQRYKQEDLEKLQCILHFDWAIMKPIYVGLSKEAIKEFIKTKGASRLNEIASKMSELEKEIEELNKEKSEIEVELNTEISESLK